MDIHGNQFMLPEPAKQFMLAGNATVTVVSKRSGRRFTYKIRASDDGKCHFVKVLTGSDNENSYTFMGTIFQGREYRRGRRSSISQMAPCHEAFVFAWRHLTERNQIHEGLEIWHEGRCGRCSRKLTVPESIESGFGPECITLMREAA